MKLAEKGEGRSFGAWKMVLAAAAMGKGTSTNITLSPTHSQKPRFVALYKKNWGKVSSVLICCYYRESSCGA